MTKFDKLYELLIRNGQTANVAFADLQFFVRRLGFLERNIKGDHFTYKMDDVAEKINLQPNGKDAKPYQVRQVRLLVLKYKLGGGDDEI